MRLLQLHADGSVTLTRDLVVAGAIPAYAILSHTWGADTDEVTFEDLTHNVPGTQDKPGYDKIRFCGEQARSDGLLFFWVDCCCINKANSTELSQAINSMFRWYQNAARCYVYLSDVLSDELGDISSAPFELAFEHSRWFTRGWTLQELLAPSSVEFFSFQGIKIGDKKTLGAEIHKITGIAKLALEGTPLDQFTINERISWAARRETTIEEDQVYCVLGIFGVHIPLIYGEGAANAMRRLRKEIRNFESELSWPSVEAPTEQTTTCLASLDEIDQSEYMSQVLGRSKHACTWIWHNPKFRAWHDSNESNLLWITAKAGYGKTTLAAHVFESVSLKQREGGPASFSGDTKPVVLTFFFQRNYHEAGQTSLVALKTLTGQLARQRRRTLPVLLQRYKRLSAEGGFTWSWANMSSVFGDMLECLSPQERIYIFLDAIDECETNSVASITEWINGIVQTPDLSAQARLDVKVLATSRPGGMLLHTLKDVPTLAIQESDTAFDIKTFIHAQVEQFSHHRQLRPEVSRRIAKFLKDNAQGMFLWVMLVMKELEKRDVRLTDAVIAERLSTIPLTLVETYTTIIQAPPRTRQEDMWRVIRWLLYACRPFTLSELEIGLCLEDNTPSWHGFAGDLEFLCGSLIRVDGPGTKIGFIHQTARSFLESYVQNSSVQEVAGLHMDARSSHETMALTCIRCLSSSDKMEALNQELVTMEFQRPYVQAIERFFQQHPFFRYATESWAHHIRAAGSKYNKLNQAVYDFLSSHTRRTNVLRLTFFIFKQGSASVPETHEPLHLAAYFNLPELASDLIIDPESSIDTVSETNDTPLVWAAEMGSTECVRLLLDAGANPNEFEYDGWSALHWAARNGHAEVAELLLESGAKIDQRDSKGNTPWDWAMDREHWGVIEVFQRRGLGSQARIANLTNRDRSEQNATRQARNNVWKLWDYRP